MEKDMKNKITGTKIRAFVFIILTVLIGIGSTMVISRLFGEGLKALFPDYYALQFVYQAISVAVGLILVFVFHKKSALKIRAEGMKEGLICGLPWIVMILLTVVHFISSLKDHVSDNMISPWQILLFMAQCILIGVSEELIFRGSATELAFDIFGADTLKSAKLSIAFTSFIFGAMHLVNAINPEISFFAAAMQAVSAFCVGLVFGALYYRSGRSIWPSVVYHALQDACAFIISGALYGVSQEESIGGIGIGQILPSILFLIWFFYLMRDRSREEA